MPHISDARILILATDGFEQSELEVPLRELARSGAEVTVTAPKAGQIRGWDKTDWGSPVKVDRPLGEVRAEEYDALVLPGGQINPDRLRLDRDALALIERFLGDGKVVAAICHAPWLLVEVDAVRGRQVTSFQSIRTDVVNAGGKWVDREVVVDRGLITSRGPDDLPAFVAKIIEEVGEARHAA